MMINKNEGKVGKRKEYWIYLIALLIGFAIGYLIKPFHKIFPNILK